MIKHKLAVIGIIIFFGSLWVGSWALHTVHGTWAEFPTFATTDVLCIIGAAMFVYGVLTKK